MKYVKVGEKVNIYEAVVMGSIKEYKYDMSKFFEECELKSVIWDTQDDNLWLATFESKSGQKRQYKSNHQTMFEFCKKVRHREELFKDRDNLIRLWQLYAMRLYTQEYNLNRLLNKLKPKE